MAHSQQKFTSSSVEKLSGKARVPGDKSMSHRSLILGGLAKGETLVSGLLEGEDVINTAMAMRALGAKISAENKGLWRIQGVGTGNLKEPSDVLDMGNSGTSTRLLMGLIGAHDISVTMTGDKSLVKRPMARITKPISQTGAQFLCRSGERLPLTVKGTGAGSPIAYTSPVASAQVKSAILLGGLNIKGRTTVIEKKKTRDHTENMIRHFGGTVEIEDNKDGSQSIHLDGPQQLRGCAVDVPGDPSSAAFPAVAALIVPGSEIQIPNIGINERRFGLFETLKEMGADITLNKERTNAGEPVSDLVIRHTGPLQGVTVPPERVPSMIDEFPVLAVAASCAEGTTRMSGLAELRVKESDRLQMMADGLIACGVKLETTKDTMTIYGNGQAPAGGATVETAMDHRIAMSFLVLGLATAKPVTVDDGRHIQTSFPNFVELMNDLGAQINII